MKPESRHLSDKARKSVQNEIVQRSNRYFKQVPSLWNDEKARKMDPLARLVYRSNLLGSDAYINNTGGGNTSSKLEETDPITCVKVPVLWVKGSGGDLRTAKKENFASLYQNRLLDLQNVYQAKEPKGIKTAAEDDMVQMYRHCTFNLNTRAPSIDTPLHGFIPYKHVDHTHPVPCIAIATAQNGKEFTREIYGDNVQWVDWMRPGFELGLKLQQMVKKHPGIKGIILGGHGLINWANDDKECYELSLELINKAAEWLDRHEKVNAVFGGARYETLPSRERRNHLVKILPYLRGQVSKHKRMIGTVQSDDFTLEFVNSRDADALAELGTSCPDHFLRTKIKPLYVDWNPVSDSLNGLKTKLEQGLVQYRKDYQAYYEECRNENSPALRDPNPTVVLIPGLGMIAWGKNKSESRVTAEFYTAAIGVMRGAESADHYTALPRQEAFDIEYWTLEEAKLQRMPPEKELSRQIVVVIGAGSGIGKAMVCQPLEEGAAVAALDYDVDSVENTTADMLRRIGMGIGVAGTGISGCGDIVGLPCDITRRESVREAFNNVVLAFGGLDHVVVTAGLFPTPDKEGVIADEDWLRSFDVNVKGSYVVAEEAAKIWKEQGLDGSMVITTSANAVVPKTGSMAYDTSKAAANHLVRELAIELAPQIRVNAVAPATVVEGSSMFPRLRVMASLKKYGISYDESDNTEMLCNRLATFYSQRTLTKKTITLTQQARAIYLLLTSSFENTTGHILPVDGGLTEAFLR